MPLSLPVSSEPTYRCICPRCRKALVTCYCGVLKPFTAPFPIGILQHPYEARNAIATARMAHLSIQNSKLFVEKDFSDHKTVNALLDDPRFRHVMLYPSHDATELEDCFSDESSSDGRQLFVWVLDAKWHQVKQMLRLSPNLRRIPMVRFTPDVESQFIIRKQPKALCLSTIESIHFVLERYRVKFDKPNREHDALLNVFQHLVQQQLEFARVVGAYRHSHKKKITTHSMDRLSRSKDLVTP